MRPAHAEIQEGSDLARWLTWASEQAHRLDPLVESPPSIIDEKKRYETAYNARAWASAPGNADDGHHAGG